MPEVQVNGKARRIEPDTTVAELVGDLGLDRGAIAVECNKEIVSKSSYAETRLEEGDILEIVTIVGGG